MRILVVNPNTTASMTATIARGGAARRRRRHRDRRRHLDHGAGLDRGLLRRGAGRAGPAASRSPRASARAPMRPSSPASTTPGSTPRARWRRSRSSASARRRCALAAFVAQRFTVVTTMERSRVPIEELVQRYGMAGAGARARRRHSGAGAGGSGFGRGARSCAARSRAPLDEDRAEAIVLGCAGMADLAAELQRGIRRSGDRRRRRCRQAGRSAGGARAVDVQARRLCKPAGKALSWCIGILCPWCVAAE